MSATFTVAQERGFNRTHTTNGCVAHKSTMDSVLDLFVKLPVSEPDQAKQLFAAAWAVQPELALRVLFYARDIRGGQGRRAVFRTVLSDLATSESSLVERLLPLVAEYGRYDDLLCLEGTPVWDSVLHYVQVQLEADMDALLAGEHVSLLAKWLPSANASCRDTRRLAKAICSYLGWTEREYRKSIVPLRTHLRIVEQAMCAQQWDTIDYSSVPSKAMHRYRNSFRQHDGERFQGFLDAVSRGEQTINSSTLYPHELVLPYLENMWSMETTTTTANDAVLDLQWSSLPNYMADKPFKGLVVADVSGSMFCNGNLPIANSIALAMYIAERNDCEAFRNKFLTFSQSPSLQSVTGSTLGERVRNLSQADWGMNTDLGLVFASILENAKRYEVSPADMPESLIIVSDMQFDRCVTHDDTALDDIKRQYADAGYTTPHVVFWNVAGTTNVPMTIHESGATLVSGYSPSILTAVLGGATTPQDLLDAAVNCERYDAIGRAYRGS